MKVAWSLCMFRPDKVRALVNLSVPFKPRIPSLKPLQMFKALYGDDYYVCKFQEVGQMEAEFAKLGATKVIKKFMTCHKPGPLMVQGEKGFATDTKQEFCLIGLLKMLVIFSEI